MVILKGFFVAVLPNKVFLCRKAFGGNSFNFRLFFLGIGLVCDCALRIKCVDRRKSLEIWRNGYIGISRCIFNAVKYRFRIKAAGVYLALRHKLFICLDKIVFVKAFARGAGGSLIAFQSVYKSLIACVKICFAVPVIVFRPIIAWVGDDGFADCDKYITGDIQLYNIAAAVGFTVVCGEIKGLAAPIGKGMGIGAALERNIFSVGSKAYFIGEGVAVRIIEHIGKIYGVLKLFINAYKVACGNIASANRGSVLAAFAVAADLDENHGVKMCINFIVKIADVNYRIFILRVKIAPNLFFNFPHICGVTHKIFKRNCIEAVFIFGIIHIFRIVHAVRWVNKGYFSVKLFIGSAFLIVKRSGYYAVAVPH